MKRPFAGSSRSSTSAVAESLTVDIVIEILLRLPAKSLMRFKCVDKRWRSLISDPGFAMSHLQRLKAGDIISSQRIFKTCPFETINYEVLDGGIRGDDDDRPVVESQEARMDDSSWYSEHVGSCDGLLCLSVLDRFVLYNPTTQERRNLPSSDLCRLTEILHGFGYDSRSDDYKIVQLKGYEKWQGGSENWRVLIFSLKSGSWKRKRAQLEGQLIRIDRGGVYWNGALHWCVIEQSEEKVEPLIVSFDLSEEKFRRVLPVPELNGDTRFKGLGIHGANLFMYHCTYDGCFQGWITSEYGKGGSWTKLFSVSTEGILGYNHWQIIPVTCTRSGKIVFQLDESHIILFNPEDNTHEDYPIQNFGNIYSAIYVETLVSPYLGCEPSRI